MSSPLPLPPAAAAAAATYTTSILNPFVPTATPPNSLQTQSPHNTSTATPALAATTTPTTTTKPTFKQHPLSSDAGLIAGIVCAIVALFVLLIIASILFWRWQEKRMARMAKVPKELDAEFTDVVVGMDRKNFGGEWETRRGGVGVGGWETGRPTGAPTGVTAGAGGVGMEGRVIELEGRERFELPEYAASPPLPLGQVRGYEKSWEGLSGGR
ncbi:hypothetical protein BDV96DRAFT_338262 [Lophiotrema nucula]|uniref:Uncharacterized protein n=1 Tax=Lophiotrema nucula TaxID=690887 RepID=A0A6A5YIT7_9PLEO|nr:hypothetical protein BDV96DRAFT_338262 [Lophiotrema nucula]